MLSLLYTLAVVYGAPLLDYASFSPLPVVAVAVTLFVLPYLALLR